MDGNYRMFDMMLFNDREWKRLKKVMVSEGWTEEEAESMRKTLRDRCSRDVEPDYPEGYIGTCMNDSDFERMVNDGFMKKYGKMPSFDVGTLRELAYLMQYDYDQRGFMNLLFKYAETGQIDFSFKPGLDPIPEERMSRISLLMDILFDFD